eukprot:373917-Prymnesium_polylepis.1
MDVSQPAVVVPPSGKAQVAHVDRVKAYSTGLEGLIRTPAPATLLEDARQLFSKEKPCKLVSAKQPAPAEDVVGVRLDEIAAHPVPEIHCVQAGSHHYTVAHVQLPVRPSGRKAPVLDIVRHVGEDPIHQRGASQKVQVGRDVARLSFKAEALHMDWVKHAKPEVFLPKHVVAREEHPVIGSAVLGLGRSLELHHALNGRPHARRGVVWPVEASRASHGARGDVAPRRHPKRGRSRPESAPQGLLARRGVRVQEKIESASWIRPDDACHDAGVDKVEQRRQILGAQRICFVEHLACRDAAFVDSWQHPEKTEGNPARAITGSAVSILTVRAVSEHARTAPTGHVRPPLVPPALQARLVELSAANTPWSAFERVVAFERRPEPRRTLERQPTIGAARKTLRCIEHRIAGGVQLHDRHGGSELIGVSSS